MTGRTMCVTHHPAFLYAITIHKIIGLGERNIRGYEKTPVNYLLKFFCHDAIFYKKSNSHTGTCDTDDFLLSSEIDTV